MFWKKQKINGNYTDTLIGEGTTIDGRLFSEGGLHIEGKFIGDIECSGDVTIGETSWVQSNITARNVINAGTVEGSITTSEELQITETGKVRGDITAHSLNIVQGGIFQGMSRMEEKRDHAAANKKKAEESMPQIGKVEKLASAK